MTELDLDAVRADWRDASTHVMPNWNCCAGHRVAHRVPALIAEVERLRAENAEHRRTIQGWQEARQADIDEGPPAEFTAVYCTRCRPARLVGADHLAQHNDAHHGGA